MAEHTKISVEVPTRDLVQQVSKAQGRSMGKQIEHWAKKDAKKLAIGSTMPASQAIPKQPDFADAANVNKNKGLKNVVGKNNTVAS